jgi:hypothetical protein
MVSDSEVFDEEVISVSRLQMLYLAAHEMPRSSRKVFIYQIFVFYRAHRFTIRAVVL